MKTLFLSSYVWGIFLPAAFIVVVVYLMAKALYKIRANRANSFLDNDEDNAKGKENVHEAGLVALVEMARIISGDDVDVVRTVAECIAEPRAYFVKHSEDYKDDINTEEEDWDADIDDDMIRWLGFEKVLMNKDYIRIVDTNLSLEEIFYDLQIIADKRNLGIVMSTLPVDDSSPHAFTGYALREISALLSDKNLVLGNLDTGCDSYSLFLVHKDKKQRLAVLAEQSKCKIDFDFH